ncbi:hypothetical protein C1631_010890 [Chryseobacterium phosphatilyticum]|uniref:Uncharacterized protein n=1 Tax=Chryseobacterium phosphatilyticum TaxID=475075 RepID=A0A316XBB8_9FLAO|nr:hypothetical protein [Chryseobacterium phosphatilyticum]PWN70469.1 hypothetical protein C1631_010890 [Chryseobacterium phosphatilyticum]
MIGGSGVTAAQSFKGYEAFVNHVSKGTFSKSQPGVPIFCTHSYLNDNSPVKTSFKFDIKNPPVYVKLVKENIVTSGQIKNADIKLYFYSRKSKTNTITHPSIRFVINETTTNGVSSNGDHFTYITTTEPIVLQNAGLNTNMTLPNQPLSDRHGVCKPRGQHPYEFVTTRTEDVEYTITPSDKYKYIVIN